MEMLSSKQKIAIIIAGVFVVGIFIFYMTTKTSNYDYSEIDKTIEETQEEGQVKAKEIIVYITGAVKNQGVVKLEEGARINNAIEEAGGLTDDADLSEVNLAYALQDGQKIYIPSKNSDQEATEQITQESDKQTTQPKNTKVIIINDEPIKNIEDVKININTGTKNFIMSLPGIGEELANRIIQYRKENGKFKTIEDIKKVPGIGDAKYESIKDRICTEY